MRDTEDIYLEVDDARKNLEKYQQGSVFIDPELLKRVTIDKGNFSARRGNGGFGGGVSFETKEATDLLKKTSILVP